MDVVMYVMNDVRHDSRVLREAATLAAAGHRVTVMGTTAGPDEPAGREERDGFVIERVPVPMRTPALVTWVHRPWRLRRHALLSLAAGVRGGPAGWIRAVVTGLATLATLPWVAIRAGWEAVLRVRRAAPRPTWVDYVGLWRGRRLGWARAALAAAPHADVHHAHDAEALLAAGPAGRRDQALVVYDSHEIFTEWGQLLAQPRPIRWAFATWERRLARRADALVTVNDEIGQVLAERFRPRRLVVLHNCPAAWTPPDPLPAHLRLAAGIPAGVPLVLCHGNLQANRGLEETAEAMTRPGLDRAHLVFLGYGRRVADAIVADPRLAGRVHVLDPVPPAELLAWIAGADVDVMAIPPVDRNSVLSSPNKLFESIAAGVPVVTSDLPVRRRIILENPGGPLGAACDPADPDSIAAAIRSILDQPPDGRAALRERCRTAARERWNWEHEGVRLVDLYVALAAQADRGPSTTGQEQPAAGGRQ